jgi:hypothetical protein
MGHGCKQRVAQADRGHPAVAPPRRRDGLPDRPQRTWTSELTGKVCGATASTGSTALDKLPHDLPGCQVHFHLMPALTHKNIEML